MRIGGGKKEVEKDLQGRGAVAKVQKNRGIQVRCLSCVGEAALTTTGGGRG